MEDLCLPFLCVFYLLSISSKLAYSLLILGLCFDCFCFTQEAKEKLTEKWMISSWLMTYLFVVVQSLSHVWLTLCDLVDCNPSGSSVFHHLLEFAQEWTDATWKVFWERGKMEVRRPWKFFISTILQCFLNSFDVGCKMKEILIKQKLKTITLYNLLNCWVRKYKRIITRKTLILV